jgi:hypothetical protein
MQNDRVITSWRRFSDTFKGLVNPGRAESVQKMPPPGLQEQNGPELAAWEDEGGKTSGRPAK